VDVAGQEEDEVGFARVSVETLTGGEKALKGGVDMAGQDEDEVGFERGSTRRYTFQVGKDLGDLRRLHDQQVSLGFNFVVLLRFLIGSKNWAAQNAGLREDTASRPNFAAPKIICKPQSAVLALQVWLEFSY